MFAGKSVEQEALEVVMHKRKVQEQRDQLRQLIQYTCKAGTWEELIRMEGKIRKERQETLYRQRERRRKFVEIVALVGLFIAVVAFVTFIIWLYINR
jgi:predicted lysophospholipase L1 biosynthesis ABC-type transport system permease subunit